MLHSTDCIYHAEAQTYVLGSKVEYLAMEVVNHLPADKAERAQNRRTP